MRVVADGLGGGLGKRRVGRTEERVEIYYMGEMEQLGVMENKLDELRQGAAGSANVWFHVKKVRTRLDCVRLGLVPAARYVPRHETDRGAW